MTRVSVVTPFYNTAPYLAECIDSVLAQNHSDFEYLLCDNHSDDGSTDIAARYAALDRRIRIVRPPAFLGQVPNYNFALRQIAPDTRHVNHGRRERSSSRGHQRIVPDRVGHYAADECRQATASAGRFRGRGCGTRYSISSKGSSPLTTPRCRPAFRTPRTGAGA